MKAFQLEEYVSGVRDANRRMLAKAITLIESSLPQHQQLSREIVAALLPYTGNAIRLGITGVPGVGKSTFIESFGMFLLAQGCRVAVLAVDPSSSRSGGSVLADKTRMERLAVEDGAFIRPSPSGGALGGVARKTRESMLVCEAAGFDVIIVETVGVGQSETLVASMVDFFLVLMLAGAGDEYQGIKKGILELADAIAINKADGNNVENAAQARNAYETALRLLKPASSLWTPPVLTCSAREMSGIPEIWDTVQQYHQIFTASNELEEKRRQQAQDWMLALIQEGLQSWFYDNPAVKARLPLILRQVRNGQVAPTAGALDLLSFLGNLN